MEKIDLREEIVLKHTDEEIIEYLATEMFGVRTCMRSALKEGKPELIYAAAVDIELVSDILKALNRRNKEKAV